MRALITKFLACLLVCCLYSSVAQAQWQTAGGEPASDGSAIWSSMDVDSQGIPYVLYNEGGYLVRRLVDGAWENVGAALNSTSNNNTANFPYIRLDHNDVPYVAYQDKDNGDRLTVQKFNGTAWEVVGTPGFTEGGIRWAFINFDNNNVPYVAHRDIGSSKGRVVRFVDGAWEYLPNFLGTNAEHPTTAFDKGNNLYVGYRDTGKGWRGSVKKYNEATGVWEALGTEGFNAGGHEGEVGNIYLALDNNDVPHVLIHDGKGAVGSDKAAVMRFNGTDWELVGNAAFSGGNITNSTGTSFLGFDIENRPFVGFNDAGYVDGSRAVFMQLVDGTWTNIGGELSLGRSTSHSGATMDPATRTLYYSYRNTGDGGKIYVRQYICGPLITAQPATADTNQGGEATLNVTAEGSNLAYQWQVDSGNGFENITDDETYSGATTASLTIAGATVPMNRFRYRVTLTSECGSLHSESTTITVMPDPSQWQTAGGEPASDGSAIWSSMDVDSQGTPYVLYNEGGYLVRRLVNGAWENVGAALNSTSNNNTANFPYIRLDHNDVPYVAYQDKDNGDRLTVQKFNGTAWEVVGTPGFTEGGIRWAFINFDNNNVPYVAHRDIGSSKGRVVRFVDGAWEYLPNFLGTNAEHPTTAFDKDNNLYVGYRDTGKGWRGSVKKYNEATGVWEALGTEGFNAGGHEGEVGNIYLALDNNDVPHVLIHDGKGAVGSDKAAVMRFNGTDWELVGNAAFSGGNITNSTGTSFLGFGADNRPVVSFNDAGYADGSRAVFMQYHNGTWSVIGGELSLGRSTSHSGATMDPKSGTLYYSYRNTGDGGRIYVRSFDAGPFIAASPADKEVNEGDALTFTGKAVGNNLTYQWQVDKGDGLFETLTDGTIYSGTTTPTLTIGFADATFTNYKYRMAAGGELGAAATDAATLVVIPSNFCYPPEITTQPVATTEICQDLPTSFSVEATGSDVVYQWQVSADGGTTFTNLANNELYSGATDATLVITGATPEMDGNIYQVLVSGACAPALVSSRTALTVNRNPTVAVEPANAPESCIGSNVNFTVGAIGAGVTYQWQVDTGEGFVDITDGDAYSGATTSTLTVVGATTDMNSNLYRAVLSGTCLSTDTTTQVALNVYEPFTAGEIQAGPGICYNTVPGAITSAALPTGGDNNFTYSWQSSVDGTNWQDVSGETGTSYTPTAAHTQSTWYRRAMHNATCGTTIYSEPTLVTVYGDLMPGEIAGNQTVDYGTMPTMLSSATDATGGNVVSYQWERSVDGGAFTAIPLATGRSFTPADPADKTIAYRRVATSVNGCGTVTSNTVTVTVQQRAFTVNEVPNALLPYGNDEQNRRWGVSHMGMTGTVRIRVFDQTGQTVFETSNAQTEWDGHYQGKLVPEGAYFFSIERDGGSRLSGSIKVIY
ncbi:T9SS type B sorting domain-containing protein [Botryobacter ruber]|uniref:T9SS type B sorting domain-containing protein n=1 Tax=Botryobacter ruber TaxID=2171629 RepID=UPI000E0A9F55|nr:gliding motility-associated C-terminal domain-containing protein [Botryobacter ruber]